MIHEYQFSIDSIDAANKATHTTYTENSICNGLAKGRRMLDKLFKDVVELELYGCKEIENGVKGQIDILDVRFGSLWTSIPYEEFKKCGCRWVAGEVISR